MQASPTKISESTGETNLENYTVGPNGLRDLIFSKAMGEQLRLPRKVDAVAIRVSHLAKIDTGSSRKFS